MADVPKYGPRPIVDHPTVDEAAYNPTTRELVVRFKADGVVMVYSDVDEMDYAHLCIGGNANAMFTHDREATRWTGRRMN